MKYKFDGNKFVTKGVAEKIPTEFQDLIWEMINETLNETDLDYLQVFNFFQKDGKQILMHSQEIPEYSEVFSFDNINGEILSAKVYVIDDIETCTMLMADEY